MSIFENTTLLVKFISTFIIIIGFTSMMITIVVMTIANLQPPTWMITIVSGAITGSLAVMSLTHGSQYLNTSQSSQIKAETYKNEHASIS